MKGLIVSNGSIENLEQLKMECLRNDYIICADGGVNYLRGIDILPDLLLGDLDSIDKEGLEYIKNHNVEVKKYPSKKDYTDTELAIDYLLDKNFNEITLIGATGSRMDHSLANIFLLKKIFDKGAMGKIIDANNTIFFVKDNLTLKRKENHYISIIPITNVGAVVSLKGFIYPLDKKLINFSSTLGISNQIIDEYGIITIHEGEVLVIESID